MKDPKIGERVRVYGHLGPWTGEVAKVEQVVHSRFRDAPGMIYVKSDNDGTQWPAHPRQCVRLKTRTPPPRVVRWMWFREAPHLRDPLYTEGPPPQSAVGAMRLVEIREGDLILSPGDRMSRYLKAREAIKFEPGSLFAKVIMEAIGMKPEENKR